MEKNRRFVFRGNDFDVHKFYQNKKQNLAFGFLQEIIIMFSIRYWRISSVIKCVSTVSTAMHCGFFSSARECGCCCV